MNGYETMPDPASVVAGWIPLALIVLLGMFMVFLFFSMRKQMRRIQIPPEGVSTRQDDPDRTGTTN